MKQTLPSVLNALVSKITTFKKSGAFLVMLLLLVSGSVAGQSSANYAFSTNTTGSLALLADGTTAVDMTTGTTQLVAASSDQGVSSVTNIGFDFYLMAGKFTQFSTSANGLLQLGSNVVSSSTYVASGGTATLPVISAFAGDSQTGSSGKIHYKVIGSTPNRCLVVEYLNMNLYYANGVYGNDATFQVRLYETSGVIEFVYGTVVVSSITGSPSDYSPGIGFSTGATANLFTYVTISTNTATTTGTFTDNPNSAVGVITNLNSAINGSRRVYKFTPPQTIATPTSLNFTSITSSGIRLNWTEASPATGVVGYAVYYSSDSGVTYNLANTTLLGTNTLTVTGLVSGTNYLWRVYSFSEAVYSSALSGSQATNSEAVYSTAGTYSFIVPDGVCSITVQAWGAGGGGGISTAFKGGGGGGGGGAYATKIISVTGGSSIPLAVGAGGTGNTSGLGGNGGNSLFNSNSVIAIGGSGGGYYNSTTAAVVSGGTGGAAASCIPISGAFSGGNGANPPSTTGNATTSGGSGASAGTSASGLNASISSGGLAVTGGVAGVAGYSGGVAGGGTGTDGLAGGGGGSGSRNSGSVTKIAGAGGVGKVIISWSTPAVSSTPTVNSGLCPGATNVSGTSTEATGATVTIYKNGTAVGTTTTISSNNWSVSGLSALAPGDLITAKVLASCKTISLASTAVTVNALSATPTLTSLICNATTSISGTSTEADGTTITVYKGGVSQGTATVASGAWSLTGLSSIATNDIITAKASASGKCESAASTSVTVNACSDPLLTAGTLTSFGNQCTTTTSSPNSFTISAINLTTADLTIASLSGYSFCLTSGGSYTSSLTISQPGGTLASTTIFVKFTPTLIQTYNGNIDISGGGLATNVTVAASGTGINNLAGLSHTSQLVSYCTGIAIATNTATLATTAGTVTYSVSPTLPVGLALNANTGAITGTPTVATATADYVVTASNGCSTTTSTINITVLTAMSGLTYALTSATYCAGSAITANAVTAVIGSGTIIYSVIPALPVGLALNSSTGEITGTPTTATSSTSYTVTASNGACSTTRVLTIVVGATLNGTYTVGSGGNYATLTAAVTAYNSACLTGPVVFSLTDATYSTSETFPLIINANSGASATNRLTIKPAATVTATISGSSVSNAIIKLNGADYVTVDGSNNGGTDRNLIITNTATTAPSVILLSSLGASLGATYSTIKNCNISTGVQTTLGYGISIGGATVASAGSDNDNNTIQNNNITNCGVGIYANGGAVVSALGMDGLTVNGNLITYNSTLDAVIGIQVGNGLNSNVNQNMVDIQTSAAAQPVGISIESGFVSSLINANKITRIITSNTGGYGGRGITVGGQNSSALTISNNIIYGVNGSNYSSFTNSSSMGICIGTIGGSGTLTTVAGGINLYNNSVNLTGGYSFAGACLTTAVYIGSGVTTLDIKNNIFVNNLNNTSATSGSKSYSIYCAAANTTFTNINYNNYYGVSGSNSTYYQGYLASDRSNLATWQTASGKDLNSISADPTFNSATNLAPLFGSPVIGVGDNSTGISTDITGATRNNPPSIGAYENGVDGAAPVITYTNLTSTCSTSDRTLTATITDYSGVPTTGSLIPRIYYKKGSGTWYSSQGVMISGSATSGSWTFTISATDMGGLAATDMVSYYVIAQDVTALNNITSSPAIGLVATDVNTVTTAPTTPNTYTLIATLAGSYDVGVGKTYATLTAAVAAYNSSCLSSAVTFNLTDSTYTTETLPITINSNSYANSTNKLIIKPASGVTVSIPGSSASAIFKLNGADYVTIDGSNNGTNSRNLTISNTYSTASSGIDVWVASNGASNGATYNTIKNCNISGTGPTTAKTYAGILSSSGTTYSSSAEAPNSNNSYTNNNITAVNNGIVFWGNASNDVANTVSNNIIGSATSSSKITFTGIYTSNQNSITINNNTVSGIYYTSSISFLTGIYIGGTMVGGSISKNSISDVKNSAANQAYGIMLNSSSTTGNVTLSNNFIYDINCLGTSATLTNNGHGIVIAVGGGYNIYNNTVNLNSSNNSSTSTGITAALYVASGVTGLDVRNNIFANTQTLTTRYAIFSAAPNTAFSTINYNNYYSSDANVGYLTSARANLAGIVSGFGGNANSISIAPTFTSATDLHLSPVAVASGNAALKAGTYISSVLSDYDGETRNTVTPAIGADEIFINGFWSGATSTVWDATVTGNWDGGTLPVSGADIVVPAVVTNSPVVTGISPTIGKLNLGTGKTLTLGANTLTINGAITGSGTLTGSATSSLAIGGTAGTLNFTNGSRILKDLTLNANATATLGTLLSITDGSSSGTVTIGTGASLATGDKLTLKSDANGTARVAPVLGSITGNVTVERYIPAKRAWRALTAPLKGSNASIFSQWQNNGIATAGIGVELWGPAGTGSTGNGLAVGPSNSMLQYVAGAWSPVTNSKTTNLFTTNGNNAFMVFPTGGYGSNLILSATTPVATTLKATGQLITGQVDFLSLPSASHTLIGNPYASPLDIATMLGANAGFSGYVWVWDANLVGDYSVGAYNLFDSSVGASGNYSNLNDNAGISGAQIQSGQAFFVKPTTNLLTFTIQEAHKGSAFSNAVFRNATSAEVLRVGLYKQTNNQWSGRDGAMAVFLSDAEANQADNKMANGSENVAFTKNGILFASEHHLPLVASDVLNVRVWNTTAGANYKLKINTEQFATTNLNATLEDVFTNSRTPIALDGTAVEYPFAVTAEAASTGNRFRIVFETNALGINNPKASGITILPNPITGDVFQVNLGTLGIGTYAYTISNALGQEVEKGSINNVTQNTNYTVKFKNSTAAGMYIMKVIGADNSVFTAKLIKK